MSELYDIREILRKPWSIWHKRPIPRLKVCRANVLALRSVLLWHKLFDLYHYWYAWCFTCFPPSMSKIKKVPTDIWSEKVEKITAGLGKNDLKSLSICKSQKGMEPGVQKGKHSLFACHTDGCFYEIISFGKSFCLLTILIIIPHIIDMTNKEIWLV